MVKTTVAVDGMMCSMCESHINEVIRKNFKTKKVAANRGKGEAVIDGKTTELERGMVLQIGKGSWHSVKGLHDLHIIEIQLGTELTEEDIERM